MAERLGIGNVTTHEMLRLLEERGLVRAEYHLDPDQHGTGRSVVLFYPTKEANRLINELAGESGNFEDWPIVKDHILKQLREWKAGGYVGLLSALLTFLSSSGNIGDLIGLGWWWNKIRAGRDVAFRDVLPSKKEFNVLAFLLLAMYVAMGLFVRPEALPHTLIPHLTIRLMYAVLFVLLYFNIKRAPEIAEPKSAPFKDQALRIELILY